MNRPRGGPGSNQHSRKPPRGGGQPPHSPPTPPARGHVDDDPFQPAAITALNNHARESPQIERCPPNQKYAFETVRDQVSDHHDYVMFAASRGEWAHALTASYDAARQAVSMLLLRDGWRVPDGARGKHVVLAEAAAAWLSASGGNGHRLAKSFQSSRKARNNFEYPDSQAPLPDDLALRGMALDNVRIVELARQELGLQPRADAVPTDENIRKWEASRS